MAQYSYSELRGYLLDTLLRDCDAMSMAHALEVRPVLLDHVLAEYVFALPDTMKLRNGHTKAILIDALRDILPQEVVNRPKHGFVFPLTEWLRTSLCDRALELMDMPGGRAIFSDSFRSRCASMLNGERPIQHWLWGIVVLLAWMDRHQIELGRG